MSIEQPIPKVTNADVERVLLRDFGQGLFDTAMAILAQYGTAAHDHGVARVRCAIVKLANGNLEHLQRYVDTARQDYRDVLSWAEYPLCAATPESWNLSDKEKADIYARDWEQYNEWLYRDPLH